MARPSGSRTVGTPATSTGRSRSRTKRRTTASCWASFSPRNSTSGCTMSRSLVTTRATPSKWPGREAPSNVSGERPAHVNAGGEAARVHLAGLRREDDRDARLLQEAQVAGLVARILVEVLPLPELRGVHEDGAGDGGAARLRGVHEAQVALVKSAHRGREAERPRQAAQRGPRLGDGARDDHDRPPAQWPGRQAHPTAGPAAPAGFPGSRSRSVSTCSSSRRGAARVSASSESAR